MHGVMMDNFWNGKNVLITGISGFVGSSVARHLLGEGAKVVGLVKDVNRNHGDVLEKCTMVIGDVTDYRLMCETIAAHEIDVIYHFAAFSIVRISARDPMSTYYINVMGTVGLLEAARNVGRCKNIIVASSDKAYGDHEELPYVESHALIPKNTYDTSKACMDMIAQSYAHNYDMPISVTRCSNIYGPGDYNFSRIVPNTVLRALAGTPPMLYDDIEKMEREFIYIGDVVEAYDLLGRNPQRGAFNIGGTGPVRIRDLTKLICELADRPDLEPTIVKREASFKEIGKQYIDASKLKAAVGWVPRTPLQLGIAETVGWYKGVRR